MTGRDPATGGGHERTLPFRRIAPGALGEGLQEGGDFSAHEERDGDDVPDAPIDQSLYGLR